MKDLSFGGRLWLSFSLPWKVLFDGNLAARIVSLDATPALPGDVTGPGDAATPGDASAEAPAQKKSEAAAEAAVVEAVEPERDLSAALQFLAILQREGRFIDFLQEDVAGFSDGDVGAAARVVHEGCKRALTQYVELAPVRGEAEGDAVELPPGYDAGETRVTGNIVGEPPFRGTLAHHGWRVTSLDLPTLSADNDMQVIAPAEVEL